MFGSLDAENKTLLPTSNIFFEYLLKAESCLNESLPQMNKTQQWVQDEVLFDEVKSLENRERQEMGAMRMNNKHLSDTIQVCRYVIENTEKLHTENIRARGLINRITKFVKQTGREKQVSNYIKQDEERAVLF